MPHRVLVDEYAAGPDLLRSAVEGMTDDELDAHPIPGTWSTRQVVCHIADFEIVYADRIKRVIAEQEPHFYGGDPDVFAAGLAYERRSLNGELAVIEAVRQHVATILRTLSAEHFQRKGIHSESGLVSLETLVRNITSHIPHHVRYIEAKREAMRQA